MKTEGGGDSERERGKEEEERLGSRGGHGPACY